MLTAPIERRPVEEIAELQLIKLKELLYYLNKNSRYYRELFAAKKIDIDQITSLADLAKIPVTTKFELQQRNWDFVCVDKAKIIDYITTSGTLGDPVTFVMTENDLERLAYNEAISFVCSDCDSDDVFQNTCTLDRRFMAGLAYFLGARKLGAGVIRVGSGIPELQWDTIRRINPTAFICVPSFLLRIIEYAEKNGIDYQSSSIKKAICIGEPIRNSDFTLNTLGKKIKEKWDLELYSTYASTEMGCAFNECSAGKGGHLHPELIIVEFLDENDEPVAEGEVGEVTVTTLGVEGMPLLRFKTGDLCYHYNEPCSCGRTTMRLGPIIGRKKQMIKYKGTSLYPPALYDILNDFESIVNYVVEVYTNSIGTDEIQIKIGCRKPSELLEKSIKDHFRAKLRVSPRIEFEDIGIIKQLTMPEMSRKPVIFFDRR